MFDARRKLDKDGKPRKRHVRAKITRRKAAVRAELDKLIRAQVFERDNHRCVRCGTDKYLTPSHVLPKSHYGSLRWVVENIKTLCISCHRWWHNNPVESAEWFVKNWPERWAALQVAKLTHTKVNPQELLSELR